MSNNSDASKLVKSKILTGRMVFMILLGFFGVVFAVNGYMLHLATSSFRGIKIQNAYQRGLSYQKSSAELEEQKKLGWIVNVAADRIDTSEKRVEITVRDKNGQPVDGLGVTASIENPTNEDGDRPVSMTSTEPGTFLANLKNLHDGQWFFVFEFDKDGKKYYSDVVKLILCQESEMADCRNKPKGNLF